MSANVRALLAKVASTVPGVSCSPYYRQSSKAGDAMVRLAKIVRSDNGFGFMATWQVWLVCPQDLAAAEKFIDEKVPLLTEALGSELIVTSTTPSELVFGESHVPGVVIDGVRATEE